MKKGLALEPCLEKRRVCELDKHCQLLRHPLIGERWFLMAHIFSMVHYLVCMAFVKVVSVCIPPTERLSHQQSELPCSRQTLEINGRCWLWPLRLHICQIAWEESSGFHIFLGLEFSLSTYLPTLSKPWSILNEHFVKWVMEYLVFLVRWN